jgi:UDP-N-acetylmuramoyl-tripeptide--D-alanyl-D-alanine ligase
MVELGEKEHEYNVEFGRQIAENADIAILVGNYNAKSITEGILESGRFDRGNLHYANQLSDATELLQRLLQAGDVVLYENDLPDNYS